MSRWSRTLQEALKWSRGFVCATSRACLTQEWCGKELAFSERLTDHHFGPSAERILPVVWGQAALPDALARYQLTTGGLPDSYFELGLARIMSRGCGQLTGSALTSLSRLFIRKAALLAAAVAFAGPGLLLPTRNAELFRWCLDKKLRVVQPMTLMSLGLYNEPAGAFLPSILY